MTNATNASTGFDIRLTTFTVTDRLGQVNVYHGYKINWPIGATEESGGSFNCESAYGASDLPVRARDEFETKCRVEVGDKWGELLAATIWVGAFPDSPGDEDEAFYMFRYMGKQIGWAADKNYMAFADFTRRVEQLIEGQ